MAQVVEHMPSNQEAPVSSKKTQPNKQKVKKAVLAGHLLLRRQRSGGSQFEAASLGK
jgi:hypothetical protein